MAASVFQHRRRVGGDDSRQVGVGLQPRSAGQKILGLFHRGQRGGQRPAVNVGFLFGVEPFGDQFQRAEKLRPAPRSRPLGPPSRSRAGFAGRLAGRSAPTARNARRSASAIFSGDAISAGAAREGAGVARLVCPTVLPTFPAPLDEPALPADVSAEFACGGKRSGADVSPENAAEVAAACATPLPSSSAGAARPNWAARPNAAAAIAQDTTRRIRSIVLP